MCDEDFCALEKSHELEDATQGRCVGKALDDGKLGGNVVLSTGFIAGDCCNILWRCWRAAAAAVTIPCKSVVAICAQRSRVGIWGKDWLHG